MMIKNLTPTIHSLCKYTEEAVLYMIITNVGRERPDIWPKMSEQVKSTKDIMITIQGKEAYCKQKAMGIKIILLLPFGNKIRYIYRSIFFI